MWLYQEKKTNLGKEEEKIMIKVIKKKWAYMESEEKIILDDNVIVMFSKIFLSK